MYNMKTKYEFRITAHINDDAMFLLREEYDSNIIFDDGVSTKNG